MQSRSSSLALGFVVVIIAIVALFAFFSIRIVGVGQAGVIHTFGVVDPISKPPGLLLKLPWSALEQLNVRTQEFTMSSRTEEAGLGADDAVQTLTSEGLTVGLDITVLFRLEFQQAPVVFRTIGPDYQAIIVRPAIRNAIRDVVAQYTAQDLYTTGREQVAIQIEDQLISSLQPRGITIENVLLRDVRLPPVIQQAIDDKLAEEQRVQQAEFSRQRQEVEAQRRVVEAGGERDAQAEIAKTLTDEYLQLLYINSLKEISGGSVVYVPVSPDTGLPVFVEASGSGNSAGK